MNARIILPAVALLIALPIAAGCGGAGAAPASVAHEIQYKTPATNAVEAARPAASAAATSAAATTDSPTVAPTATPSPAAVAATPTQAPAVQAASTQPAAPTAAAETPVATPAAPPAAAQPVQLTLVMKDESFSATSLSVKASQPVTLTQRNDGKEMHNFALCQTSGCGAFIAEGDLLASGKQAQVEFTLTQPGTYKFECEVHTKTMVGTVVVS